MKVSHADLPPTAVTIIIPQHGHAELTLACVRSLRANDQTPWQVLVVDDGSPAECLLELRRDNFRGVDYLSLPRRGVTAAWNAAASLCRSPYLIFLNNDVVCHGPWVARLLQPLIEGRVPLAGVRLRREASLPRQVLNALPASEFYEGWCFAVRRDDWERIGGFDLQLEMYWSDTDLQARLWQHVTDVNAAISAGLVADLPLVHLGHRTAHDPVCLPQQKQTWLWDRNRFIQKWPPR